LCQASTENPPRALFFHEDKTTQDLTRWWNETTQVIDEVMDLDREVREKQSLAGLWIANR